MGFYCESIDGHDLDGIPILKCKFKHEGPIIIILKHKKERPSCWKSICVYHGVSKFNVKAFKLKVGATFQPIQKYLQTHWLSMLKKTVKLLEFCCNGTVLGMDILEKNFPKNVWCWYSEHAVTFAAGLATEDSK